MIPRLGPDPQSPFPDVAGALQSPDGLLACGGGLEPARLLNAYRRGIFPWYTPGQPILWWCPSTRCVIFPEEIHVSRRLRRVLRQHRFTVTADTAFAEVVAGCASPRRAGESTWITPAMIRAYTGLHDLGLAHSIEVWRQGRLAGGLYGLALGRVFFGESMFSRSNEASKVALVCLCRQLQAWRFAVLDCQLSNRHLTSMGAVCISRESFLAILGAHAGDGDSDGSWTRRFAESRPHPGCRRVQSSNWT